MKVSPIKRRGVHHQYGGESRGGAEFTRVRGIRSATQYPAGPERLYSATVRRPAREPDLLPAGVLPEAGKGTYMPLFLDNPQPTLVDVRRGLT